MAIGPEEINWLAVVVCGVGTFLLGGLWYTALFGKLWQKLSGYTHEQMQAMQKMRPAPKFFGGMIAAYLVMALGMAALWAWFDVRTYASGAIGGAFVGVVAAAMGLTLTIASEKRLGAWVIDVVFFGVVLAGTGAVLAGWR